MFCQTKQEIMNLYACFFLKSGLYFGLNNYNVDSSENHWPGTQFCEYTYPGDEQTKAYTYIKNSVADRLGLT